MLTQKRREETETRVLKVKTSVRAGAGGWNPNHNETFVRDH